MWVRGAGGEGREQVPVGHRANSYGKPCWERTTVWFMGANYMYLYTGSYQNGLPYILLLTSRCYNRMFCGFPDYMKDASIFLNLILNIKMSITPRSLILILISFI